MYSLYKSAKGIQIFIFIIAIGCVVLDIQAWKDAFTSDGVNGSGVLGGLVFLGLALLFFKITASMSKPYSKIDKIRKTNPELVKDYEQDFERAENFQNAIWFGQRYLFFHAYKFTVTTYHEVQKLRLYKHYTRKTNAYELEITISGETVTVNFDSISGNKDNVIAIAQRLSAMTGAELSNELD